MKRPVGIAVRSMLQFMGGLLSLLLEVLCFTGQYFVPKMVFVGLMETLVPPVISFLPPPGKEFTTPPYNFTVGLTMAGLEFGRMWNRQHVAAQSAVNGIAWIGLILAVVSSVVAIHFLITRRAAFEPKRYAGCA